MKKTRNNGRRPLGAILARQRGRSAELRNFGRAVRLVLRYPKTITASLVCSLMVGILWGGNIAALYPVVEVVFRGESLHDWIDHRIAASEQACAQLADSTDALKRKSLLLKADQRQQTDRQLRLQREKLASEQRMLQRMRRLEPYVRQYTPAEPFRCLLLVIALLVVGTIVKSLFLIANVILVTRAQNLAMIDLQNEFFQRTLRMDVATIENDRTSGLLSHFTHDIRILESGLGTLLGTGVREPCKMLACLIGAALISWQLLLVSIVVLPFGLVLIRRLAKIVMRYSGRSMDVVSDLYARLSEAFDGIKVVQAFTMEEHEQKRFHRATTQYARYMLRYAGYRAFWKPIVEVMSIVIVSMAILVGAHLVLSGDTHLFGFRMTGRPMTPAALLLFFAMLGGMADPARKTSNLFSSLLSGVAAANRIYAMLDRQPQIRDPDRPIALPRDNRELVLENIEFHYRADEPVLRGINLHIRGGETIALVGQNGCGKSTLVNLIPRFHDPQAGRVCLGNVDVRDLRLQQLRGAIGVVAQDTLLFNESIIENIRYGAPTATDEEVMEGSQKGVRARVHQRAAGRRIPDCRRPGWQPVVRWPATTDCVGTRHSARSSGVHPGRSHQPDRR
jgi:subfamily B ATP-binding cassette protein MsbA